MLLTHLLIDLFGTSLLDVLHSKLSVLDRLRDISQLHALVFDKWPDMGIVYLNLDGPAHARRRTHPTPRLGTQLCRVP